MLSRLKIGPKLLLAPGVVLLLLVLLSSAAYYAMVRQHQSLHTIVGPRAVQLRSTTELVAQAQRVHADTYKLLTWISSSFSRPRIDLLITQIHRQNGAIERSFAELVRLTPDGSAERRHVEQAQHAHGVYVRAAREVVELAHADQTIGANAMIKPEAAFAIMAERMTLLARLERDLSEQASDSAAADFRVIAGLMPVVILLAVGVSLAITMAVRRVLLVEIRGIGAAALGLASGDLTIRQRDYGDDEIGETSRALDAGIRNLNGTLRTVLESARTIGNTSRDISLGSLSMHSRAVFRSRSLDDAAASMQELADTVSSTANSALAANRLAQSASTSAREGGLTVERMAATMATVKEGALRAAEVAGVIDAFASEAGTLALNAALEAAQGGLGGKAGRDFADAAGEVRLLAQRAVRAAREVRELAARSVAEIEGCTEWALNAGSSMQDVASSVREVEDLVSSIGSASAGQASELAQVNQAIVRMDEVTQQNCALVEEAAAAARTLQMQALSLSRTVAAFRLDETETAPAAPPKKESGAPQASPTRDLPRERRLHERSHLRLASSRK
ncbi:methyl-accepting chemotaxis protein [Telluria aromaticivorans]|uniref:Methyl-accepting chemotaxis protein n=1 Tax=Telluria aromaticivorans TaxID=2725995 RepID=A0A7Y2JVH3_9BURK|nr:methyl-accepting chemotaxis protein [Telluria aromaticivorans]NNG21797.1 methyl-accepting chemotaxis protein [Telluria aromaticivorans]